MEIDFDGASRAWRANKTKKGSSFQYCCGVKKSNGKYCHGIPVHWSRTKDSTLRDWGPCKRHKDHMDECGLLKVGGNKMIGFLKRLYGPLEEYDPKITKEELMNLSSQYKSMQARIETQHEDIIAFALYDKSELLASHVHNRFRDKGYEKKLKLF
uniref:Uncharacterized protein n=1 Tax=viral metagenome TaxID=1070528 RepID=A0A6C0EMD1_9ZZZZ